MPIANAVSCMVTGDADAKTLKVFINMTAAAAEAQAWRSPWHTFATYQVAPHFAPRSNVQEQGGFTVPVGSKLRLPLYPYSRHDGLGQSPASPVEAN